MSIGPDLYNGLPGLIIELESESEFIFLDKIVFKEKQKIQKPEKGIKKTNLEYNKIVQEMLGNRLGDLKRN